MVKKGENMVVSKSRKRDLKNALIGAALDIANEIYPEAEITYHGPNAIWIDDKKTGWSKNTEEWVPLKRWKSGRR